MALLLCWVLLLRLRLRCSESMLTHERGVRAEADAQVTRLETRVDNLEDDIRRGVPN